MKTAIVESLLIRYKLRRIVKLPVTLYYYADKLLLNIIEAVIRRPIPEKAEGIVTIIGFAFLMLLMILVTWNDIQRYFIH